MLIDFGADEHKHYDRYGNFPLHLAVIKGFLKVTNVMLNYKNADVNVFSLNFMTPLHFAAKYGHVEIVTMLLMKGARVNVSNDDGITPLRLALQEGHLAIVTALQEKGAE